MKKIVIALIVALYMSGCIGFLHLEAEGNFESIPSLGIDVKEINDDLYIKSVLPDYPAAAAGLKPGDIIISVDGSSIKTLKDYILSSRYKKSDEVMVVEIKRGNDYRKFDLLPKQRKRLLSALKIEDLLLENKRVSLAIVVSDIRNSYPNSSDWILAEKNHQLSDIEAGMLQAFSDFKNFTIVDRSRLQNILAEHRLEQLGLISDEIRNKIGEFTGATLIYDITYQRFIGAANKPDDYQSGRLIDVQTGNVLAVDSIRYR